MKNIKSLFFLFLIPLFSSAQEDSFWSHIRYGSEFGVGFGSDNTTLSISPNTVYDFNDTFSIGLGIGYQYNEVENINSNVISPNIVALYRPIREIEFSSNLQQSFVSRKINSISDNYSYPALNLGTAYRLGVISLGIQYDILYKKNKSVYPNAFSPFVRVLF